MGREIRKVPADWHHPTDDRRQGYQPLHDQSFAEAAAEWKAEFAKWEAGERPAYCTGESRDVEFWEYWGAPPERDYYRPDWPEASRTHFQIYETVSEGTPISPPCATIEELAQWYADNGDPVYGHVTYEHALAFVTRGSAPSLVIANGRVMSGVDAVSENF